MYRSFFGLRERPFDLTPDPRYLVLTEAHREALSNLEYGIASRKGITLLLGEAGTGKTTLIRTALGRQPARGHCVHLHNPALTRAEFVEMLAVQFELSAAARASKTALLLELEALIRERHQSGQSTVLVIDEAQSIPLDLLEEVRLLANIESDDVKLLPVVLAGQPEVAARLNGAGLRQLKQRIALRCELRPLTLSETAAYIAGRIAAAGGVGAQVFTREAVMLIHERSSGIPRTISVIADNALLTAFAQGRRPVTKAIVLEVCRDLDLQTPGAARGNRTPSRLDETSGNGMSGSHVLMFDAPPVTPWTPQPQPDADTERDGAARNQSTANPVAEQDAEPHILPSRLPKRRRFSFLSFTRQG